MEIQSNHFKNSKHLNIAAISVAAVVTFLLLMILQIFSQYKQLHEELHTQAAIIGANSTAALTFQDKKASVEILEAIYLNPRIVGGALYLPDGKIFAITNNRNVFFPDTIPPPDLSMLKDKSSNLGFFTSMLRHEITQDHVWIGTLLLRFNDRPFYWNLFNYALGLLLTGFVAFLLSFRFTARLRKQISFAKGQLEQMALYDRVTNLPNRRYFEYELKKTITRIQREKENAALFMIDVDDFKKVNDLCGHQTGDEVLRMIATRLRQVIRTNDIIARVGGDEFAAILYSAGTPEDINNIAQKMIEAIAAPFPTEPIPSHVGLSIGMTMMPNDSDDPATLIRWSDMAMYDAKSHGKNRANFFSEEINRKIRSDLHIEAELREAIRNPESGLYVAYQPQVLATTRKIAGVEALIRWRLDDGTQIPPMKFIPVAEKTGLIVEMGDWLLKRICTDLAAMRLRGIELPKIAINVSPRELTRGNLIVERAAQTLLEFGEDIARFQFEITENALMDENGADVLETFNNKGFSLAIDDFGSGYSSLGYLKRFKVSALKIDKQFVQKLPDDREDAAIVSAVIKMSWALGITVIAEGVETEAQADFLSANGCDVLQGYLISRPIPPQELIEFINAGLSGQ